MHPVTKFGVRLVLVGFAAAFAVSFLSGCSVAQKAPPPMMHSMLHIELTAYKIAVYESDSADPQIRAYLFVSPEVPAGYIRKGQLQEKGTMLFLGRDDQECTESKLVDPGDSGIRWYAFVGATHELAVLAQPFLMSYCPKSGDFRVEQYEQPAVAGSLSTG